MRIQNVWNHGATVLIGGVRGSYMVTKQELKQPGMVELDLDEQKSADFETGADVSWVR